MFQKFINKYNNKFVEAGGSSNALNQCVDLVNQYIAEVLGLPKILGTDANNLHRKAGSKYTWIPNTPTNKPKNGDIIIWSGKWGHTGIFIEGSRFVFKSFDQNYPKGSPAHIQKHNYTNVLGWLRPKKGELTMSQYSDIVKAISKVDTRNKIQNKEIAEERRRVTLLKGVIKKNQVSINILEKAKGLPVTQFDTIEVGRIRFLIDFFTGIFPFGK